MTYEEYDDEVDNYGLNALIKRFRTVPGRHRRRSWYLPTLVGLDIERELVMEFVEEFRRKKEEKEREKEELRMAEEEKREKKKEEKKNKDKKEGKNKAIMNNTKDDENLDHELHSQQVDDEEDDNIATANTSRQDAPYHEQDDPSSPTPSSPDDLSRLGFLTTLLYMQPFSLPLLWHNITSVLVQPISASYVSNHAALAAQAESTFRDETEVKQWLENWRKSGMALGLEEYGFPWDAPDLTHNSDRDGGNGGDMVADTGIGKASASSISELIPEDIKNPSKQRMQNG